MQLSTALRNGRADQITSVTGAASLLRIYSGAMPANCAAAASGVKLSEDTLGSPLAPPASGGVLSPTLPSNVTALANGTAGYWRAYKSDGTTCTMQGTVGLSAADMILDNLTFTAGAAVAISGWTSTEAGA